MIRKLTLKVNNGQHIVLNTDVLFTLLSDGQLMFTILGKEFYMNLQHGFLPGIFQAVVDEKIEHIIFHIKENQGCYSVNEISYCDAS